MDSNFKVVFVKTSSSNKVSKTLLQNPNTLNGALIIQRPSDSTNENRERIRIVINLRGLRTNYKLKTESDWEKILEEKNPLSTTTANFQLSEEQWFEDGITWVIPTHIFATTKFKIELEPSYLPTSGFIVEIYRRDAAYINEVQPTFKLRHGAIIDFSTSWHLHSNPSQATPTVRSTIRNCKSDDSEEE